MIGRVVHHMKLCNIERFLDDEEDSTFRWNIFDKKNNKIGDFEFLKDEQDRIWLNGCGLSIQGKGIGSEVIKHAVNLFDAVYFCITPKDELIGGGRGYDSRYLTEEGVVFMKSCLRKKIIKPEWVLSL